jgi:hypothetical protein
LKPAQANSLRDPISKKLFTNKRAGGVVQGVGPLFKLQYRKKEKKIGLEQMIKKDKRSMNSIKVIPLLSGVLDWFLLQRK